jgi:endonuclease/exonuclease/phosphatase family metal-dependent hydrolase
VALPGLALPVLWMAGGLQKARRLTPPVEELSLDQTAPQTDNSTLTVVIWNIAWAYGWGSEGSGPHKSQADLDRGLARIGEGLQSLQPDLVLLQEVDFDATRSFHVDQASYLALQARLPYVARAESWKANWVPFPYWPPKRHFGSMSSGGAILSRWPLRNHAVQLLPKPEANPAYYNLFYLFRYLQSVEVELGDQKIQVFNTHLEAFNLPNRELQAALVREEIARVDNPRILFGGDFNTVPLEASRRRAYSDEPKTDHTHDQTLPILLSAKNLRNSLSAEEYRAREAELMTFPAQAPNRKLDHALVGEGIEVLSQRVAHEVGTPSDHLPLVLKLRIR